MADTIHTWPDSLGVPLLDGYSEKGATSVLRSQFDAGPAKVRRRFTGSLPSVVGASLILSKAGIQTLDDFYWTTLRETGLFYWVDHRRPLEQSDNVAVYRFTDVPSYSPDAPLWWKSTLALERMTTVQGQYLLNVSNGSQGMTT